MCGIIGQFGGTIDPRSFEKAREVIRHRGPDDSGTFHDTENNLILGNRRLAIIDLSPGGHQPKQTPDGRFNLSFNGEIFNYLELREELRPKWSFQTDSDTEVLLAAFASWGAGCFSKLNGQFACAIWDKAKKELTLARDHFGVKPLFYARRPDGALVFASEIKALLALGVKAAPNDRAIFEYLAYGLYNHSAETFFSGITSLPAGHTATVREGNVSFAPYWDLVAAAAVVARPKSEEEATLQFGALLEDAIRLQLRSDVPVGINLSSGIDSSTLLHFVRESLPRVHAFTSRLDDPVYDEGQFVEPFIKDDPRVMWHTATFRPAMVRKTADELLNVVEQPYGGMHTMQYFNLYRECHKEPITVLLEGQGMDEILAGYSQHLPERRREFIESFSAHRKVPEYVSTESARRESAKGRLKIDLPFSDELKNAQWIDLRYRKLPRTLRINDHISMAFSKELRVPYLDPRLVAFGFSLPEEYKIKNGVQKYLLRTLVQKEIPHAMREKDRIEFPAFQTGWFRKYFRNETMEILQSASFRSRPYWSADKAIAAAGHFFSGEGYHSFFLWQMLDLELWLRKYIDQPH